MSSFFTGLEPTLLNYATSLNYHIFIFAAESKPITCLKQHKRFDRDIRLVHVSGNFRNLKIKSYAIPKSLFI